MCSVYSKSSMCSKSITCSVYNDSSMCMCSEGTA
jgi:hypothetical protein